MGSVSAGLGGFVPSEYAYHAPLPRERVCQPVRLPRSKFQFPTARWASFVLVAGPAASAPAACLPYAREETARNTTARTTRVAMRTRSITGSFRKFTFMLALL